MHPHHWHIERTTVTWKVTLKEHLNPLVSTKHNTIGMKLVKVAGKDGQKGGKLQELIQNESLFELDMITKGFSRKL